MQDTGRTYIAIDLKSFYASVECVEHGLDPLTTNLVVADRSRTEKTICLAVSPSLKAYGIPGRARLFEVEQRLREVNAERRSKSYGYRLTGKSVSDIELKTHPDWEVDYITATPRMAYYIEHSTRIYKIYLNYRSHGTRIGKKNDRRCTAADWHHGNRRDWHQSVPLQSSNGHRGQAHSGGQRRCTHSGTGRNDLPQETVDAPSAEGLLARGERHSQQAGAIRHLHDGRHQYGIYTMGDIARQSVRNEELLYQLFGVNAELLIDHAWGWEPCTMEYIKAYKPATNSFSSGQVLQEPYTVRKARVVVREMAESAALDLLDKRMVTDQLVLTIGYDTASLSNGDMQTTYKGEITTDHYGRKVPKHAHGTANLEGPTSSARLISEAVMELFDRIVNPDLLVRRINLTTNHVVDEETAAKNPAPVQYDLFTDYEALEREQREEKEKLAKERKVQTAILNIKKQFGKNAILKGLNYEEGATAKERNQQIGGHKA